MSDPLYLGFDLSTQSLKGVVIDSKLNLAYESAVDFDRDCNDYGTEKGVLTNSSKDEIYAPVTMWLDALDLVLDRLKEQGLEFSRVKGISGAGMQHGTVFWNKDAESLLSDLDARKSLTSQLGGAFSHPYSPNWQDASTQEQCEEFDKHLGSESVLADVTGSKAHHRFSGPQIMKFRQQNLKKYQATSRISLVSSFLASMMLGKIAPIDISDVCGMSLWDIQNGNWHADLLSLAAGNDGAAALKLKLGDVRHDGGGSLGNISQYFVKKYNFAADCSIAPFTGDNPSTILALPLQASDAIVSLGTSTTFLMSTPHYNPDPAYHFFNHPTTPGLYMFMLCYKNGSLAREQVRDTLNAASSTSSATEDPWSHFNVAALSTPALGRTNPTDPMHLSLYFPLPEIVPAVPAGTWHFTYMSKTRDLSPADAPPSPAASAREILESQLLSLRLRAAALVTPQAGGLPAQPRRVYAVGGAAANPAIARLAGEVLGGAEGVWGLDVGGRACALGAAHKALWARERGQDESFEALVGKRWKADEVVRKVDEGYRDGVWQAYGEAVVGFGEMERVVLEQTSSV